MISLVMPVAYDYRYCFRSLEAVYDIADEVVLGLDRDRISWSGKPFELDRRMLDENLARIDRRGIIRIVEEDFHAQPEPMVNDVMERRRLSSLCKPGNWIVQIDSDEIALNARDFRSWLSRADPNADVQGRWITVFKSFGDKCLVANEPNAFTSVATRVPGAYQNARVTGQPRLNSNLILLHYSWGRTRDELAQKLTNWSHSRDFDVDRFLELWESVDLTNYRSFQNFHPLHAPLWRNLSLVNIPSPKRT